MSHFQSSCSAIWLMLVAVGLSALVGCYSSGPPLGYVSGTVTLDGQPVEGLVLTFIPKNDEGTTSFAETDAQGHYVARFTFRKEGVLLGEHDVTIDRPIGADERGIVKVPRPYARRGLLTATVDRGHQTIDFELESDIVAPNQKARR